MIKRLFSKEVRADNTKSPLQSYTFVGLLMLLVEFISTQYGVDIKPVIELIKNYIVAGSISFVDIIKLVYQLISILLLLVGTFSKNRKPLKI